MQEIVIVYSVDDSTPIKPVVPVKPVEPAEPVKSVEEVDTLVTKPVEREGVLPSTDVNNNSVLIGIGIASIGLIALTLNLLQRQNKEDSKKN
ncbi:MAG: LPXTG cell wall anchor domain-containing protein [Erysipelothrix sp.]